MTSPLRRKRPTTVRARITPARTLANAIALTLVLGVAGLASAEPLPTLAPASWQSSNPAGMPIQPASYQPNMQVNPPPAGPLQAQTEQTIQLEPPGPTRLFRMESEDALKERMRHEARERVPMERIFFPDEPVLSRETYVGRRWQPRTLSVEPNYLGYSPLWFEQKNFERYGWDLGPVSTALSPLTFFGEVAMLPYIGATGPFRHCESNAGYCLPGDPVPLMLYPPEISGSGALVQTASVLAILAIFP